MFVSLSNVKVLKIDWIKTDKRKEICQDLPQINPFILYIRRHIQFDNSLDYNITNISFLRVFVNSIISSKDLLKIHRQQ